MPSLCFPKNQCWPWQPTWRTKESTAALFTEACPATRREQVRRFLARETEVVVSTDAIGMGLNLPIRRIVFVETRKFDGVNKRTPESGGDKTDCRTGRKIRSLRRGIRGCHRRAGGH